MNERFSEMKNAKKSVVPWIVMGISAVLTVALLVFLGFNLLSGGESVQGSNMKTRYPYSEAEEQHYYRGFDATALAAVVCDAYPSADSAMLALGEDENFLRMRVESDGASVPLHFSLRSTDMAFTNEFQGFDRGFLYTSRIYEQVAAAEELSARYAAHLDELGGNVTGAYFDDFDGDGLDESILLAANLMDAWLEDAVGSEEQMEACRKLTGKTVCIYLDPDTDQNLAVHSFCLSQGQSTVKAALWDNGMVQLVQSNGNVTRFIDGAYGDYDTDTAVVRRIFASFRDYLEDLGYTDVRLRLADVSAAPGKEMVCCYSNGSSYTVVVYALLDGRVHPLYHKHGIDGAVYLVSYQGTDYLLDYSQKLSDTYAQTYSYSLFRFSDAYIMEIRDSDTLRVEANQGGGSAGSSFFGRVNGYLNSSAVCYDPYSLMGYSVMQETGWENMGEPEGLYLRISNCSTNKIGVITLQDDDSFLNFRSGPSTQYDRVLINESDPESYVKQVQGSPVTVIMPYNTGNSQNPIWAQIRIHYQNKVLEGYSSQRYIRIEGIRHIAAGERFQITAETNDTALYWFSSDTAVASIGKDGTLTGIQPGLVLVTVISESGLEDSCLIMID